MNSTAENVPTTADRIKGARLNAGLTQVQLARAAGVSLRALSNAELGHVRPQRGTLHLLAHALGLEVSDLGG